MLFQVLVLIKMITRASFFSLPSLSAKDDVGLLTGGHTNRHNWLLTRIYKKKSASIKYFINKEELFAKINDEIYLLWRRDGEGKNR